MQAASHATSKQYKYQQREIYLNHKALLKGCLYRATIVHCLHFSWFVVFCHHKWCHQVACPRHSVKPKDRPQIAACYIQQAPKIPCTIHRPRATMPQIRLSLNSKNNNKKTSGENWMVHSPVRCNTLSKPVWAKRSSARARWAFQSWA